ncbi:MAG: hypothetical protein ABIS69_01120 [Sediminibacterium sp.]
MKNYVVKPVCFFALVCVCSFAYAQESVSEMSRPYAYGQWHVKLRKADALNKPEFLFNPNYLIANFYAPDSKEVVKEKKFKLNLQLSKLLLLDENSEEMEVISPIKKIEFIKQEGVNEPVLFERGFSQVNELTTDNFYQVLVSGKAYLLLDTKFAEVKEFAYGGTPEIRIDKVLSYYGAYGGSTIKITKLENVVELMSDKLKEISDYIKQEKIKVKSRSDLEKLFTYYNNLPR